MKYKTVDISTLKGIKKAERLQANGWKFVIVGVNKLQFSKEK